MKLRHAVFVFILLSAVSSPAYSQPLDPSPEAETGRVRFRSYFEAEVDSINLFNGNLNLNIPLFTLPGRELSTGLRLVYNAQKWDHFAAPGGVYTGGWRTFSPIGERPTYSIEYSDCQFGNQDVWNQFADWRDGLGTKHRFWAEDRVFVQECGSSTPPSVNNHVLREISGDVSELFTGNNPEEAFLKLKDGKIIEFTPNPTIRTPNGNYLTFDANGIPLQDTLGRGMATGNGIQFSSNKADPPLAYSNFYTIVDANGNPQTYELKYEDQHAVLNPLLNQTEFIDDWLLEIKLPNGRSYTFEYGNGINQGYLTKVTLPSGGFISYEYGPGPVWAAFTDYVIARHVSFDGVSIQSSWFYQHAEESPPTTFPILVTVTNPEGGIAVHRFNSLSWELETTWKQPDGTPLRKETKTWSDGTPTVITTSLPTATQGTVQRTTTLAYNGARDVIQREERDWGSGGPGALMSRTEITYTFVDDMYFPLDRIQVSGINPANGAFELQGKTEFFYDEGSVTPISSCTTVPNKGAPGPHRRNLTRVRRYTAAANFVDETMEYDELGNMIAHNDPMMHPTTVSFTDNFSNLSNHCSFAFPTSGTNAESHPSTTEYDYNTGLVTKTKDARNLATTQTYDLFGRLKTITEPNTRVITYTYDDVNRIVSEDAVVAAGKARKTQTYLDRFNRLTRTVQLDPAGNIFTDTEYDGNGRVKRVSQPYRTGTPVWTTTTYDALDRPVTITNPDGTARHFLYLFYSVKPTDEAGNERWLSYNGLGQLFQVEEPNPTLAMPFTTNYKYYVFGSLYSVIQPGLAARTFTHNWLGFKTSEQHPESGTTSYVPDPDGRLQSRTDARGVVTTYSYDDIDRLQTTTYSDSTPTVSRTYDQNGFTGFLTTMTDGAGSTTFTYKSNADLLDTDQRTFTGVTGTITTTYSYDLDGRLTTLTYPSGRSVTYSYQDSGGTATDRLNTIHDNTVEANLVQSVQDNAASLITNQTLGNAVAEVRSFNTRNQVTALTASLNGTSLMNLTYGYGAANNGRIRTRTDAVQPEHSTAYTFDAVNRLTAVANGSWAIGWDIDAYGNRTSQTPSGLAVGKVGSQTSGYANNRNNAFTHDPDGNVTNDGSGHTYAYDGENRIRQVDGGTIQYVYDGEGQRVKKTVGSTTTFYLYGLTGLMSEFSTTPGVTQAASSDRLEYRVAEQTGTPVLLMSSAGTVIENNRVLPYGELWSNFVDSTNEQKFTTYDRGDPQQADSELDYAMARFYTNRYGRFISPDSISGDIEYPQSWNRYTYSLNDPIDNTDPSGAFPCILGIFGDCGEPSPPPEEGPCLILPDGTMTSACPNVGGGGLPNGPFGPAVQLAQQISNTIVDFVTAPRDPTCMARMTTAFAAGGGVVGGAVGAAGGGTAGAVGGSFVAPGVGTVGGGFAGGAGGFVQGAAYGTLAGGALGGAVGWVSCMSSTPGGGGGGGHKYAGKTVREILKEKKASIKNAPLPPGSPTWDSILNKTWEQIDRAAKSGQTGYDTIRKLLTDARFNK